MTDIALRPADYARQLLRTQRHGVLATQSLDVPGYPFGSIAPYALDAQGEPLIWISTLAQHTKNILADPRVSLTIHEATAADVQAGARLTWIADAEAVAPGDTAAFERYRAYFADSAAMSEVHDFALYRLLLKRARYIGGFGRIYWVEAADLRQTNPFAGQEADIVAHMNEDHGHNLLAYCRVLKGFSCDAVTMLGLDGEGFDVLADGRLVRFDFGRAIGTPDEARMEMVRLAKAAR